MNLTKKLNKKKWKKWGKKYVMIKINKNIY